MTQVTAADWEAWEWWTGGGELKHCADGCHVINSTNTELGESKCSHEQRLEGLQSIESLKDVPSCCCCLSWTAPLNGTIYEESRAEDLTQICKTQLKENTYIFHSDSNGSVYVGFQSQHSCVQGANTKANELLVFFLCCYYRLACDCRLQLYFLSLKISHCPIYMTFDS